MSYCGANFKIGKTKAFMIFNKKAKQYVGSYCRGYHEDYVFHSVEEAKNANVFGIFKDTDTYEVRKVVIEVKRAA